MNQLRLLPDPAPAQRSVERIRRGPFLFTIYRQARLRAGRPAVSYTLAYSLHNRRRRITRARRADLEADLAAAEIALANGQPQLTAADTASYQRALELAQGVAPLEILVSEAVAARARASASTYTPRDCAEVVEALLESKRAQGRVGAKWLRALAAMLRALAAWHTGPLHHLDAPAINRWLDGLNGGLVYRHHHRAALAQLITFAQGRGWCPRDWSELQYVDDVPAPPVQIQIWPAAHLRTLLDRAQASMVPFIALQAFAGLRHEEIRPGEKASRKRPVDWSDFDWTRRELYLGPDTGKTGERLVPLGDTALAWLKPLAQKSGPVVTITATSDAMLKLKKRAGLPPSRNVLRKSWISYRIALTNNRAQVAEEAGTSLAKINTHYRRAAPADAARAWFNIMP